jgi:hypothetical protein
MCLLFPEAGWENSLARLAHSLKTFHMAAEWERMGLVMAGFAMVGSLYAD